MPRGRPPLYRRWDESVGAWVLDEAGEALERRQLELPPLASRPDDLNAWAVANPPPRRDDFATQELFDEAREPWYAVLLGTRLPPYGQNAERAKAWGMACMRPSERSLSHDIAQERAVKMAEELAAAAAQAPGRLSVCARVPLQHALAAGRLGRASSSNVSRRSWDKTVTAY